MKSQKKKPQQKKPKKSENQNTTSSEKRPRGRPAIGHKIPGTDKRFHRQDPGEDPRIEEHPDPVPDIEETLPEPNDEASKHKFPPPKKHPLFRKYWMEYIDNICERENFKTGHLLSLEILCDLHVEYEDLRAFLRKHGRSYKAFNRTGLIWKFYPEVMQLTKVQTQIKDYMKVLGLLLRKDKSTANPTGEKEEWA